MLLRMNVQIDPLSTIRISNCTSTRVLVPIHSADNCLLATQVTTGERLTYQSSLESQLLIRNLPRWLSTKIAVQLAYGLICMWRSASREQVASYGIESMLHAYPAGTISTALTFLFFRLVFLLISPLDYCNERSHFSEYLGPFSHPFPPKMTTILSANSFSGYEPLRLDLTHTKSHSHSRSHSSLTSSFYGESPFNYNRSLKNEGMLPLGSGHQISRKPIPRRRPTINRSQPGLVNIPELFVQTGTASLDGPLPMLVRAESHCQSPEDLNEESWQENEIPEELGYVNGEEPEDIRNIIQESLDEHRALRASKLHTQAIVVRTTITMSSSGSDESIVLPNVETSATASIRSRSFDLNRSPDRPSSSDRASPDSLALASTKSGNSIYFDTALHNLRSSTEIVPTSSQESLSLSSSSQAKQTQESQQDDLVTKPMRNQMLFRILGRRPKIPNDPPEEIKECTSCFDEIPNLKSVSLPCRHPYCGPCFSQLVSTAIQSEDTFPPKCCLQEIPRRIIDSALSPEEMTEYDQKALEYAVDVGSRYYCGSPECAKWIDTRKATRLNGALECPHCQFWMCTSCRGAQHTANQDCPQDFDLSAALEQAERAGWRRCYNCRTMVELNTGCRHITCKCKAEFW